MKKFYFCLGIVVLVIIVVLGLSISCNSSPASPSSEEGNVQRRDTAAPELRVTFSPRYFSPDGDKEELAIYLSAIDESPIDKWKVEIREPQPPYQLFYQWEGRGTPPASVRWNGRSSRGELVQSACDYPLYFTASDLHGNAGRLETLVEVGVVVIREGSNLRIQVPSVVFSPNSGNWDGLDNQVVEKNLWILKRVAQILNKYGDYKVRIEGHANHTANPNDWVKYQAEQLVELQPLSESRAKKILDELVLQGIDFKRLTSYGIGGSHPIAAWEDKDNWWKNRRVEFILIK
jgi:flagellar motor protein MotB